MTKLLSTIAILTTFLVSISPSHASAWKTISQKDPITDKVAKAVYIENEEGYRIAISRNNENKVFMTFGIPDRSLDLIDGSGEIIFRIGQHEPTSYGNKDNLGGFLKGYVWRPRFASMLIWHGKESEGGPGEFLSQLMESTRLVVRYPVAASGTKDVFFTYTEPKQVLVSGLPIDMKAIAAYDGSPDKERHNLLVEKLQSCKDGRPPKAFMACIGATNQCSQKFPAEKLNQFVSCINGIK